MFLVIAAVIFGETRLTPILKAITLSAKLTSAFLLPARVAVLHGELTTAPAGKSEAAM
jgi:hypothetical protein